MPNEILLIKSPFSWCDRDCRRGAIWSLLHKPFWRGTGKGAREGGRRGRRGGRTFPAKQASGSFQQGLELRGACHHPPGLSLQFSGNAGTHQSLSSLRGSPRFTLPLWLLWPPPLPFSSPSQIPRASSGFPGTAPSSSGCGWWQW